MSKRQRRVDRIMRAQRVSAIAMGGFDNPCWAWRCDLRDDGRKAKIADKMLLR